MLYQAAPVRAGGDGVRVGGQADAMHTPRLNSSRSVARVQDMTVAI